MSTPCSSCLNYSTSGETIGQVQFGDLDLPCGGAPIELRPLGLLFNLER